MTTRSHPSAALLPGQTPPEAHDLAPTAARPSQNNGLSDLASLFPKQEYDPEALTVAAAARILRERMTPIARTETVPLMQALGRVLATDIRAPINVPLQDNSAMDGYAFNGTELAAVLPDQMLVLSVAGIARAGHPLNTPIHPGECARIMTGALIPAGADTVIPHEYALKVTDRDDRGDSTKTAEITGTHDAAQALPRIALKVTGFARGANRRLAGEDLAKDAVVLKANRELRAADVGVLASLGIGEVVVKARLKVAFFSTGDELRSIGQPLDAGGVYDSNRYTLNAMLAGMGVEPIDCGVVRDDPVALSAALRDAANRADAVLTSGGVSAGEADFVRDVFREQGDIVFWKLAMRPGRPFAFGELQTVVTGSPMDTTPHTRIVPFFGLPGNPVAVMASFYHLVRDALRVMMGTTPSEVPRVAALAAHALPKRPGRTEFARGIARRDTVASAVSDMPNMSGMSAPWRVSLAGAQGSGVLSSMSEANCFVILEHDRASVKAGETVDIMFFEGLI